MKYLVVGSGMMGSAVAYDLAKSDGGNEVLLTDIDLDAASQSARAIGANVRPLRLDVNSHAELVNAMRGCGAVVSAVSYSVNVQVTKAALEARVHMCDLGGNDDVVESQIAFGPAAHARGVTIIPNCGLAPGLINVLAVTGSREFEAVDSIHLRVGGLPQHPRPPLNYQIVFSVEGLINEYVERASVIMEGEEKLVDAMSGLEEISFPEPFGSMEAFITSGGLSRLAMHFTGKVRNLDYKTIRYKGHCDKFKTLLELGFATSEPMLGGGVVRTNREFFADLLRKKLSFNDKDVVLARATISGLRNGKAGRLAYDFIDYYDDTASMTAMMRTTAFPTSIIAQMLANDVITERGVFTPEICVPGDRLIEELGKRNMTITRHVSETGS